MQTHFCMAYKGDGREKEKERILPIVSNGKLIRAEFLVLHSLYPEN